MARLILTSAFDRQIRDKFKLTGWVSKRPERQQRYFHWCGDAVATLKALMGGDDPPDDAVVVAIQAALLVDDSFTDHVAKKDAEFLATRENWEHVYRAGAGTIYHEYLVACEKGRWADE